MYYTALRRIKAAGLFCVNKRELADSAESDSLWKRSDGGFRVSRGQRQRLVTEVWFMSEQLLSLHQLQKNVRRLVETMTFSKLSVHLKNILNEPIICPEEIKEISYLD